MSQRILHIIDSLKHNGAAAQLRLLAPGLMQARFDVHVAALDDQRIPLPLREGLGEGSNGLASGHVTPLARRWTLDPLTLFRLRRLFCKLRPDIVHTWTFDASVFAGAVLQNPRRLVVGQYRIEPWKSALQWHFARRAAGRAQCLVTNCSTVRDWYVAREFSANRFTVIPVGVAASPSSDISRGELLRELDLPADARLIGIVNRLVPNNRVQDLIWAADLLRVLHDNLRVLIIGDGPLRTQLVQYARMASDLDHIRFLGERDDVWRIMPHFDVLWNGSENIGQSVAILEAMAAGVPVIASDTPANRELIVEGETGYLIPLGHRAGRAARARHTDRIFTDRELATRLATTAKRRAADHHDANQMAARFTELYSSALG